MASKENIYDPKALAFVKNAQNLIRTSKLKEAKSLALDVWSQFDGATPRPLFDKHVEKSRAIVFYYIVKVISKFQDFEVLTGPLYAKMSEDIQERIEAIKTNCIDLEVIESFCRLVRARMIIDQLTCRRDAFQRNTKMLEATFGQAKLEELLKSSVDFAKNYVALLCFNFNAELDTNFDLDIVIIRIQVIKAQTLNQKYLVARKDEPYTKLSVKVHTMQLEFFQILTKDQFVQCQQKALSGNLKNKYTPGILCHIAIFMLRRSNLPEALARINRAIQINSNILADQGNQTHESYIKLFLYKSLILAKQKNYTESENLLALAQKCKSSNYGDDVINHEQLAWQIQIMAMIGQTRYEKMFDLILKYIDEFEKHISTISFKEDSFLKFNFLLKIAPEVLSLRECQFPEGHRFFKITQYRDKLVESANLVVQLTKSKRLGLIVDTHELMFTQNQKDVLVVKQKINENLKLASELDCQYSQDNGQQSFKDSYHSQLYYVLLFCKIENRIAQVQENPEYEISRVSKYIDRVVDMLIKQYGNKKPTNHEIFIKPLMLKAHVGIQLGLEYDDDPLEQVATIIESLYGEEPELQCQLQQLEYMRQQARLSKRIQEFNSRPNPTENQKKNFKYMNGVIQKKLDIAKEKMHSLNAKAHEPTSFPGIQQRYEIKMIEFQTNDFQAVSIDQLKDLQHSYIKQVLLPFLDQLSQMEANDEIHEVIQNSYNYKQIKSNLLQKHLEITKANIDMLSPDTPQKKERKDVDVQEALQNLIDETEEWLTSSSSIIELSPSAALREMIKEDQCLCRYELGQVLKAFEMDEEALEYLQMVVEQTKQVNVLSNAPRMIKELQSRIDEKNSYRQKFQEASTATKLSMVVMGAGLVGMLGYMVLKSKRR